MKILRCIKSCNSIATKAIIPQYKTGYATMMVNNLTSANSISSNCEKDFSIPLLDNLHDFLLEYKDKEPANQNAENDPSDIIEFVFPDVVELNVVEDDALSYVCSVICRKMLQVTDCEQCVNKIQSKPLLKSPDLFSINDDCDTTHKRPSENFILNFKTLFCAINEILPHLCSEKFLKTKILNHINNINIEFVGCLTHNAEMVLKLKQYSVHYAIMSFCKNINSTLAKKITAIPSNANHIQKLAIEFRKKRKGIGRYSDLFDKNE